MNLVPLLENFLYEVSNTLYLPVIAGCSLLVAYVPVQFGLTLGEGWRRQRGLHPDRTAFERRLRALCDREAANGKAHLEIEVERLLQAEELALLQRLDRIRFVIKAGPAIGLMGTLIPMGISLAALADGDIPTMATHMVTAFTATVAGLGSGVGAYLISLSRERWVRADLREMAYVGELALARIHPAEHHLQEESDHAVTVTA